MLVELAVQNRTTTYSRLNTDANTGYNYRDAEERDSFTEDIEAISMSEVQLGRPPIGCLVVFKSGSVTKPILNKTPMYIIVVIFVRMYCNK